ncbi:hypothetical protein FB45DRAFT_753561 [Roridomyces roridus]|uniref:MULE transposase domain-containing protein n=1 Tax=Roridomyces roridus TaxID=1738132 RepID=A0AAD7BIC6_9AGAR|nr:hypothetical protein FB45DRAFT_753561 [Roridomyces roridus]
MPRGAFNSFPDEAINFLVSLGAHIPEEIARDVRSKLAIRRSDSGPVQSTHKNDTVTFTRKRRVLQCLCGSDHTAGPKPSKERATPWKNVGCPFYFDITTTHMSGGDEELLTVDEVVGHLSHSPECDATVTMDQNARIPLEPRLRDYLLFELESGLPLAKLKEKARSWASKNLGDAPGNNHHRFILNNGDMSSLYRTQARLRGILRQPPEQNIDLWFRRDNPAPPDPRLSAACLSYSPHIKGQTERLCLIFSTPEQQALAWRFGHKQHMLMDLTFGFCNGRLLLAVLMALDEHKRGIPVSLIVFSAKEYTKAVHSDYNTEVLQKLLAEFKAAMGTNSDGEQFEVTVGTTDNDTRERQALLATWKEILLLLCIFHTWQSWRNGLNRFLRSITDDDDRKSTRRRLAKFAIQLLKETTEYSEVIAAYNTEIRFFESVGRKRAESAKKMSKAALAFLGYFQSYLKEKEFWVSWSPAGALLAAEKLGIPVSQVARTTNALESWNARAKGRYISHHQHSGRLLRPDHWIYVMVIHAIPEMLADWLAKRQRASYYEGMKSIAPLIAAPTLRSRQAPESNPPPADASPPLPSERPVPRSLEEVRASAEQWIAQATSLVPAPSPVQDISTLEDLEKDPTEEEEAALEDADTDEIEALLANATLLGEEPVYASPDGMYNFHSPNPTDTHNLQLTAASVSLQKTHPISLKIWPSTAMISLPT